MTPLWLQTSTQLHIGESAEISGLFYSLKILAGAFVEVLVVSFVLVFLFLKSTFVFAHNLIVRACKPLVALNHRDSKVSQ